MKSIFYIFIFMTSLFLNAHGQTWSHDGLNARISTVMTIDNRRKTFNTLNIEFSLHSKCKDAFISVIAVKDKKLGKHKTHDFKNTKDRSNKLNFFFNGQEFIYSTEKTIRSTYENGIEFGTLPSFNLIEKIIQNQGILDVYIGDTPLIKLEKTNDPQPAVAAAKKFCLNKI